MLLSMFNLLCKLVVGWTFYKTVMSKLFLQLFSFRLKVQIGKLLEKFSTK